MIICVWILFSILVSLHVMLRYNERFCEDEVINDTRMDTILHQLKRLRHCLVDAVWWDMNHVNWCRILSIDNMSNVYTIHSVVVFALVFTDCRAIVPAETTQQNSGWCYKPAGFLSTSTSIHHDSRVFNVNQHQTSVFFLTMTCF